MRKFIVELTEEQQQVFKNFCHVERLCRGWVYSYMDRCYKSNQAIPPSREVFYMFKSYRQVNLHYSGVDYSIYNDVITTTYQEYFDSIKTGQTMDVRKKYNYFISTDNCKVVKENYVHCSVIGDMHVIKPIGLPDGTRLYSVKVTKVHKGLYTVEFKTQEEVTRIGID